METNQEYERFYRAKKQVKAIKGFYNHLISFMIVNTFLIAINLIYSPVYLWFFYPLLGWGLGVFFHAMKVFNFMPFLNKEWEERKIKEFIE
ncbi:MAG: 2TM domain-containing protein [Flavobacteriaceae bacterium]|nr:2TM domain-containing protein [Flavobacteriaceae bacterium]